MKTPQEFPIIIDFTSQFLYITGGNACTSISAAMVNVFLRKCELDFFEILNDQNCRSILQNLANSGLESGIKLNYQISESFISSFFSNDKKNFFSKKRADEIFKTIESKDINYAGVGKLKLCENITLFLNEKNEMKLPTVRSMFLEKIENINKIKCEKESTSTNNAFILTAKNHSIAFLLRKEPDSNRIIYVIIDSGTTITKGRLELHNDFSSAYESLLKRWEDVTYIELNEIMLSTDLQNKHLHKNDQLDKIDHIARYSQAKITSVCSRSVVMLQSWLVSERSEESLRRDPSLRSG